MMLKYQNSREETEERQKLILKGLFLNRREVRNCEVIYVTIPLQSVSHSFWSNRGKLQVKQSRKKNLEDLIFIRSFNAFSWLTSPKGKITPQPPVSTSSKDFSFLENHNKNRPFVIKIYNQCIFLSGSFIQSKSSPDPIRTAWSNYCLYIPPWISLKSFWKNFRRTSSILRSWNHHFGF